MLQGIILCAVYLGILFFVIKLFGVKYTEIIKNTSNIKYGIVLPVGITTTLLIIISYVFGWLPEILQFEPKVNQPILWIIPIIFVVRIILSLGFSNLSLFDRAGLIYLFLGTLFVGISEEILVRGILVNELRGDGYSIMLTGIISSLIFGVMHFINYFNGQSLKVTSLQVASTVLMGLGFYITYVISGTLWLPILLHFMYDFSTLTMDKTMKSGKKPGSIFAHITIAMFVIPLIGIFLL